MNISTTATQLSSALQTISGVVARKSTMPILSNALFRSRNGTLDLIGTDLELQVTARTAIQAEADVTLDAKKALGILKTLPHETAVKMVAKDSRIYMQGGKSKFTLQSLPAEDFPLIQEAEFGEAIKISQGKLKALLSQVAFAMAVNDVRYYLCGLLFDVSGGELRLIATDGHRLAFTSSEIEGASDQSFIVPIKAVNELMRLLGDQDEPVTIRFAQNQMRVDLDSIEIVSKLIEGKFPDWKRVIPKDLPHTATIDRAAFLGAIQRASALKDDKLRAIKLKFSQGQLSMAASNAQAEESSDVLDIDYAGNEIEIGFNVTYLLDVLSNMDCETVLIKLMDSSSSGIVTSPAAPDFVYVVMPMRI